MTTRLSLLLLAACTWVGCRDLEANPIAGTVEPASGGVAVRPAPGASVRGTPCPSKRPYDGLTCSADISATSAVCEYGSNVDADCNTSVECRFGTWRTRNEPPTCTACDADDQVTDGAPCGVAADDGGTGDAGADAGWHTSEQLCAYPSRTCACTKGDPALRPRWACTETPKDCPSARPLEGQPCTMQQTCNYGACVLRYGLAMRCTNAVWTIADITCP